MSHNDDGLNELLKPLRGASPDDLQMQKWQNAVRGEVEAGRRLVHTTRRKWAFQLIAAMLVGFVMGAILVKSLMPTPVQDQLVAEISADNATFERSHANLD